MDSHLRSETPDAVCDAGVFGRRAFLAACALPLVATEALVAAPRSDYHCQPFEHSGLTLNVWTRGSGPLVFVLHEMNGLTDNCFALGDALIDCGFSAAIPEFFGDFGGGALGYVKACSRPLFRCYLASPLRPVDSWVKGLALRMSGDKPFGAIGNCMTGAHPLVMLRSERCVAPVLCQPAFPFRGSLFDRRHAPKLALSDIDVEFARLRSQRDKVPILAIRFEKDGLCPPERFKTLDGLFGPRFHAVQIAGKGHSTLITHRCDRAFRIVVSFLRHRLLGSEPMPVTASHTDITCDDVHSLHGGTQ